MMCSTKTINNYTTQPCRDAYFYQWIAIIEKPFSTEYLTLFNTLINHELFESIQQSIVEFAYYHKNCEIIDLFFQRGMIHHTMVNNLDLFTICLESSPDFQKKYFWPIFDVPTILQNIDIKLFEYFVQKLNFVQQCPITLWPPIILKLKSRHHFNDIKKILQHHFRSFKGPSSVHPSTIVATLIQSKQWVAVQHLLPLLSDIDIKCHFLKAIYQNNNTMIKIGYLLCSEQFDQLLMSENQQLHPEHCYTLFLCKIDVSNLLQSKTDDFFWALGLLIIRQNNACAWQELIPSYQVNKHGLSWLHFAINMSSLATTRLILQSLDNHSLKTLLYQSSGLCFISLLQAPKDMLQLLLSYLNDDSILSIFNQHQNILTHYPMTANVANELNQRCSKETIELLRLRHTAFMNAFDDLRMPATINPELNQSAHRTTNYIQSIKHFLYKKSQSVTARVFKYPMGYQRLQPR
ncbi:MAG: hypothetical protein ACON5A_00655 [Candidatus Comchoanobacterales bacterium]